MPGWPAAGSGWCRSATPAGFAWAGPWIALRPAADGSGPRAAVMFGVPSGADLGPRRHHRRGAGRLHGVCAGRVGLAATVRARAGRGRGGGAGAGARRRGARALASRRPWPSPAGAWRATATRDARGTFASGRPGSALTLIEAGVLDELGPIDHRRNVVVRGTDLNALVGPRLHPRRAALPRQPAVRALPAPGQAQRRRRAAPAGAPRRPAGGHRGRRNRARG